MQTGNYVRCDGAVQEKELTCCPRQIRGPALNGRNINGLGVRNFFARSSRKRSGSNSSAVDGQVSEAKK
jgi:hypothetical protein